MQFKAEQEHYNIVVLGSGPAGLTAAIYTSRARLTTLVLEGHQPGGQLTITTDVENYPGFPEGIMGPEFIERTRNQAKRFGTEVVTGSAIGVELGERPFTIQLESMLGEAYKVTCDALIVATGAVARLLGLEAEDTLMGYGLSTCATCDGAFFKDKRMVVVGGGDSAMEEANFLTRFGDVTIVHRRVGFRASAIMLERAQQNPKITWELNKQPVELLGNREDGVRAVVLEDTQTGERSEYATDAVFYAIGHIPKTEIFAGLLDMDDAGYIQTRPGTATTNLPGVFAAGDCQDTVYRQAITAAGSGCMAAMEAERWIEEQHG